MPKFLDKKEQAGGKYFPCQNSWTKNSGAGRREFPCQNCKTKEKKIQTGIFLAKVPRQKERRPGGIFCAIFFFKKKNKKNTPKRLLRRIKDTEEGLKAPKKD